MAGVVEPHERLAAPPAPGIQRGRLGAGHVGGEAAQKQYARPAPRLAVIGEGRAIGERQSLGAGIERLMRSDPLAVASLPQTARPGPAESCRPVPAD